jgi:predicted metalloprotease with PDZ domain
LIDYRIRPADLHRHHFEVACRIEEAADPQSFRLPSWIPGSYLMREFARYVVAVSAIANGAPVAVQKVDKSAWQCRGANGALELTLTVYALDESVRGAYVDAQRAYFNGACVFVLPEGREHEPVRLTIEPAADRDRWRVATSLPIDHVDAKGFGVYCAADYDELIDHPVEISDFSSVEFVARGVPHRLALAGRFDTDLDRVAADLRLLCEAQIEFFGGQAPFEHYCFLGLAVGSGYGGLEHRASSSLILNRDDLPKVGESGVPPNYQRFLGLCSHEYFHSWHMKRTKPLAFMPYRLHERNYTRLLWVFEGITTYYQELFLLRSGLVGVQAFLRRLGEMLTRVYRSPGRRVQSVSDASFDAWDVLYKPQSDSPNSSISYYSKGALVAMALDLRLRKRSDSAVSLDSVVLELWARYGRIGDGLPEDGFERLASEIAGEDLEPFFDAAVRGTEDLPLQDILAEFGVSLEFRPASGPNDKGGVPREARAEQLWIGAAWRATPQGVELTSVLDRGPAQLAGLNPGDVLIALDGLRVDAANLCNRLERLENGQTVPASFFRGDVLLEAPLRVAPAPDDTCVLGFSASAGRNALRLRRGWLGE